jgi:hypothetical protein
MEATGITEADRKRYARARAAGRAEEAAPSALVDARYDERRDAIELSFQCGVAMTIPRGLISEFDGAPKRALRTIRRLESEALECEPLDVHIFVPGLVEHVMGSRFFAVSAGRRGGKRRSKLKAAAARRNGALGGRPPKRRT